MAADPAGLAAEGVAAALVEAGPLLPLRDPEQMDLLREADGNICGASVPAVARQRGRPAGARNKRTAAVRDYLLSRYAHPLEVLAQIISRPIDVLAVELGCKPVEALAVVKSAAAELAPYLEGKMPVAVDVTAKGDFRLVLGTILGVGDQAGEALAGMQLRPGAIVEAEFEESVGNQALGAGESGASE